jgi:hypothetical protein
MTATQPVVMSNICPCLLLIFIKLFSARLQYTTQICEIYLFFVGMGACNLTTLSVLKLYIINDRMINEYGAICGMRICRGNQGIQRKPTTVSLCLPQILHYLTWDWTKAATVGSHQLTSWAMACPIPEFQSSFVITFYNITSCAHSL